MQKTSLHLLIVSFIFSLQSFAADFAPDYKVAKISDVVEITRSIPNAEEDAWVIFDLDETLLRTKGALGSESWFNWQDKMNKENSSSALRVSKDFPGLLKIQDAFLDQVPMIPVDNTVVSTLRYLAEQNIELMILTARGPKNLKATLRELWRNELDFKTTAPDVELEQSQSFLPYNQSDLTDEIATPDELATLGFDKPAKPVQFTDGVFLSEGQNKGGMIRLISLKANKKPKTIIFVDNTPKHLERAEKAAKGQGFEMISVQYVVDAPYFTEQQLEAETQAWIQSNSGKLE